MYNLTNPPETAEKEYAKHAFAEMLALPHLLVGQDLLSYLESLPPSLLGMRFCLSRFIRLHCYSYK